MVLLVFTAFELFRSFVGGGWALFLFEAFDGYLAYLAWHEYNKSKSEIKAAAAQ